MGDVNIVILDGGLGLVPSSGDEVHAVIGIASAGVDGSIVATKNPTNLVAARGYGPGVEAACFAIGQTGKTCLFAKAPASAPGVAGAVDSSEADGSSVHTIDGEPFDDFGLRFVWVAGGTRGTAGAKFKYSLDDGETYSAVLALGTADHYAIPNSGITMQFAAGDFVAGDLHTSVCTAPTWGISDVVSIVEALGAGTQKFRLIHLVGAMSASDAVSLDTALDALRVKYRFTGLLGNARDFASGDTDENGWIDDVAADFASLDSTRVSVAAGHYLTTSAISGRRYRRPLSFGAAARLMARPIQEHAGRVRTGSLKGLGVSSTDGKVYHDSRNSTGLVSARFMTARTRIGRPGLFIDNPAMMASPSSDFQIWPHRSVIDKASDITYEVLVDVLNDDLQLDPNTGHILDKEAKAIESRLRSAFRDGLLAKRAASAVTATISRDDNIITTKTLTASVRVTPKGYAESIDASIGFTNPALNVG